MVACAIAHTSPLSICCATNPELTIRPQSTAANSRCTWTRWFAPMLAAWHGVPPVKALFFSWTARLLEHAIRQPHEAIGGVLVAGALGVLGQREQPIRQDQGAHARLRQALGARMRDADGVSRSQRERTRR